MPLSLDALLADESLRLAEFPIARRKIFLAHAAITTLPARAAVACARAAHDLAGDFPPFSHFFEAWEHARASAAQLLPGASPSEIALLGPTSLGLSLVARGLGWQPGDEIICYADDYPANVYPWTDLRRLGVVVHELHPDAPGLITPELVASALSPRTRLVALASAHFLSGIRIDIDAIGRLAHAAGALFCLDAIQSLGAFPTPVHHVDFLSADSHKWMLGPMAAGVFYVAAEHQETLRPALLGAWNVRSPDFVPQPEIAFEPGARRYEPGVLNDVGIAGMAASLDLLLEVGAPAIAARLMHLRSHTLSRLLPLGFQEYSAPPTPAQASAIVTLTHPAPRIPLPQMQTRLESCGIVVTSRQDRQGQQLLRLSPHFYNTTSELDTAASHLATLV